jgi:VWFA-related protein
VAYAADPEYDVEVTNVAIKAWPEITVYFHLRDRKTGQLITPTLTEQDISVTEDNKLVKPTKFTQPGKESNNISVLLVIDISGSMYDEGKIDSAKEAANNFVNLMQGNDVTALLAFNDSTHLLQNFTADKTALSNQVNSLSPGGGTLMYEALYAGIDLLKNQNGRKLLIVLTDGISDTARYNFRDVITAANNQQLQLQTIGVGHAELDENGLQALASQTQGSYHRVENTSALSSLYQGFSQSLHDEYSVSYNTPRTTNDGTTRPVNLTVKGVQNINAAEVKEPNFINFQSSPFLFLLFLILLLSLLFGPLLRRQPRVRVSQAGSALSLLPPLVPNVEVARPSLLLDTMPPKVEVQPSAASKVGLSLSLYYDYQIQPPQSMRVATGPNADINLSAQMTGGTVQLEMVWQPNGFLLVRDLGSQALLELNFKGSQMSSTFVRLAPQGAVLKPHSVLRIGRVRLELTPDSTMRVSLDISSINELSVGDWQTDLPLPKTTETEAKFSRYDASSFRVVALNHAHTLQSRFRPAGPLINSSELRMIEGSEVITLNGISLKVGQS